MEKYSRIVTREEVAKKDFNISPTQYVNATDSEQYRPIAEIVEDLDALEVEAAETSNRLRQVL